MPQKQKDVIYDKLNRRGEPITHVTSPPPQLDKVYFPPKNIQFSVFTWISRLLLKQFGCEDFCTFLEFFQLCPHLAPLRLYSGSRACESGILFILIFFAVFFQKLVFVHIFAWPKEYYCIISYLKVSIVHPSFIA